MFSFKFKSSMCEFLFTLVRMANFDIAAMIKRQIPISATFLVTGRRTSHTNLCASIRISTILFRKAQSGATKIIIIIIKKHFSSLIERNKYHYVIKYFCHRNVKA
jgi:hypothetical protein